MLTTANIFQKRHALSLDEIILDTPGVFNYSAKADIQISPKVFTPIYLNLEILLSTPEIRQFTIAKLAEIISPDSDIICGIESGGSYFASAVADLLHKPLFLLRKHNKTDDYLTRIVGHTPSPNQKICLVDDVFSSGHTVWKSTRYLKTFSPRFEVCSVLSYGYDEYIGQLLGIKINSISHFPHLLKLAVQRQIIQPEDVQTINRYTATFKNFLVEKNLI